MIVYRLAAVGHVIGDSFVEDYEVSDELISGLMHGAPLDAGLLQGARLLFLKGHRDPDILDCPFTCILASARLCDYIRGWMPTQVEFFPAPLFDMATGEQVQGYWICNVTNVVDCVDMEHSRFRTNEDGEIRYFQELCLRWAAIADQVMFRPRGKESRLFVSEAFAHGMSGKGLKGIEFVRHRHIV